MLIFHQKIMLIELSSSLLKLKRIRISDLLKKSSAPTNIHIVSKKEQISNCPSGAPESLHSSGQNPTASNGLEWEQMMVEEGGQKLFKGRSLFGKKLISFKLSASPSLISLHTYPAAPQLENTAQDVNQSPSQAGLVKGRGGGGQGRPPQSGTLTSVAD